MWGQATRLSTSSFVIIRHGSPRCALAASRLVSSFDTTRLPLSSVQPSDFSVSPAPTEGGIDVSIDSAAGTVTITVATAIDVIPAADPAAHAVYDLYGRRVLDAAPDLQRLNGTLPHGIYIIDGRKVLVR